MAKKAVFLLFVFWAVMSVGWPMKGAKGSEIISFPESGRTWMKQVNSCSSPREKIQAVSDAVIVKASWYGPGFHGRLTASGEIFNENALTAAHKELAFGTKVKVTCVANGKSVIVTINDRGPYIEGRHIDLSKAAAKALGMIEMGVAPVKMEILSEV